MDEFRSRDAETLIKNASRISFAGKEESFGGYKFSDEYKQRMTALEEKYKDLVWLPLDIPKIEFDSYEEFLNVWEEQSLRVVRVKPDVAEPWEKDQHPWKEKSSWNVAQFNGLHLYQNPYVPLDSSSFAAKMYEGKVPMFERILEQVNTFYPIHTLISLFIWESRMPIAAHRDKGAYWKCPTEFRTMLFDENDEPTLYVSDENLKPVFVDLPDDTNTFCWSNGKSLHGSTYYGKRKFILCASIVQHSKKTEELIDRSILKYRDKLNYKL